MAGVKRKGFGGCGFEKSSPTEFKKDTNTICITIPFEDALKLNLAIAEGVRHLNEYTKNTEFGKNASFSLIIHFGTKRIRVEPDPNYTK
ncbi:hypothetical protein HZA73_03295 [candidate division TA06 bacterium]|nr:hypothetical protein [candidate division TA06 bacterium]